MLRKGYGLFLQWPDWVKMLLLVALTSLSMTGAVFAMIIVSELMG